MLNIRNLSLYLSKDLRSLLEDFNFSLNQKDKVALIGEEGNGKSTLLKAIAVPEEIEDYVEISGEINITGEVIAYLPQSMDNKILEMTTAEYFNKIINWELMDYNHYYKLLGEMKFSEDKISEKLYIKNLSGGEKIKFQLLCEMMKSPTLLLLDEPSNDLDLESVKWLESFINNLDLPLIFISHDEVLLENCSNTIIHIEQLMRKRKPQYSIERMGYLDYTDFRSNRINKQEQLSRKEKEEFDEKMDRYRQVYDRVHHEQKVISRQDPGAAKNLKDKMHSIKSMGRRFEKEKENLTERPDFEKEINILFDSTIKVPNGKQILDYQLDSLEIKGNVLSKNISLSIYGPEKICIVGNNGAGKSILIKKILEVLRESNLKLGYMPQNYFDYMKPKENSIDFLKSDNSKEEITKVRTYLGSMKFTEDEMFHKLENISGGQRAKLYFSKMILDGSEFLLLDEPTRNLSPLSGPEIRNSLKNFGGGILAISHDRKLIKEVFDKVYYLSPNGLSLIDKDKL